MRGEGEVLSRTKRNLGLFILIIAITLLLSLVSFPGAFAISGYSVTSNYHGIDVPLGATVTVTATTTDTSITDVVFIWRNAEGIEQWRETVQVIAGQAQSLGQPDSPGDWGVQALFIGPDGTTKQNVEEVVSIKATSFFLAPEYPVIGTAGIAIAVFAALVVVKRKEVMAKLPF